MNSEPEQLLQEIFRFSQEDIAANRAGQMTEQQKDRFRAKHRSNTRFAWILCGVILGIGFLGFCGAMIQEGTLGWQSLLTYLLFCLFVAFAVSICILYYRIQLQKTIANGAVHCGEGTLCLKTERRERSTCRLLLLAGREFSIEDARQYFQLQESGINGRSATLYYSLPRLEILSIVLH